MKNFKKYRCFNVIPYLFFSLVMVLTAWKTFAQKIVPNSATTITSPDKNITVEFYQKQLSGNTRQMFYKVSYKNMPVILESVLDLQLDNHLSEQAMALKVDTHKNWCENLVVTDIKTSTKDTSWQPVCGEQKEFRDHYNTSVIGLVKDDNPIYRMSVEIRAYNEGVGIRYFFPENEKGTYYRVMAENDEFVMPAGTKAWFTGWAQGKYDLLPLNSWSEESERPLTLQLGNGLNVCLAEAGMTDYARTKFKLNSSKPNTILTSMYTPADLISPVGTPWRVIIIGEKTIDLINNNSIVLNLNEPSKIKNTSWIRPGKIMRVMTQTTKDAKENIDFAVKNNLQYILFDWKWYGPAFSFSSDATKVAIPDFDLPGIIQYGKEKGIGIWLYVNLQALYAQSDSLFAIYKKWGVKGVKFGFVIPGSHRWTTWLEKEFQIAAENEIMLNVHDDWRPTGEQRTWPNLMTAEGIRGNEEMPSATHNTVLPFTRFIAGPADYTICYYDKRIKTTHAHQLAMAVVYYSPIQTMFWYDKPSMGKNEPELEFWNKIPTVWDESRALGGKPGEFITEARRSGNDWFVGSLNGDSARSILLDFSFLQEGKTYKAVFYSDDDTAQTQTKVRLETREITSAAQLKIILKPAGGQAVWLTPVND